MHKHIIRWQHEEDKHAQETKPCLEPEPMTICWYCISSYIAIIILSTTREKARVPDREREKLGLSLSTHTCTQMFVYMHTDVCIMVRRMSMHLNTCVYTAFAYSFRCFCYHLYRIHLCVHNICTQVHNSSTRVVEAFCLL